MNSVPSLLLKVLNEKKKKNSQYSLRSLAKSVKISPAQLSSIINKRKKLSPTLAIQLIQKLNLTEQESIELLSDVHPEMRAVLSRKMDVHILRDDQFQMISDWIHYAILSLSYFKNNKASIQWISKKLNISKERVEPAFKRLERLGLISIIDHKLVQISKPVSTTTDIPSTAIKAHHRQNLKMAEKKIDEVEVALREFSSITFPIHIKNLPKAKQMINDFKMKLYNEIKSDDPTDVYTMSIQLFPLTQPLAEEK